MEKREAAPCRFAPTTPFAEGGYRGSLLGLGARPLARALEGLVPAAEQLLALRLAHPGLVPGRLAPMGGDLLSLPESGGDPGEEGGPQRGRLAHLGHDHRRPEDVR